MLSSGSRHGRAEARGGGRLALPEGPAVERSRTDLVVHEYQQVITTRRIDEMGYGVLHRAPA